jgi:sugar transferase (PEP-CTERM/EpsH1 system associated)
VRELLFLCHRIPYPPNKGDKIRSWNILRHLAERFDVHLACFVDDPEDHQHEAAVRACCAESLFLPLARRPAAFRSTGGLVAGEALTLRYYRDGRLARWVDDLLSRRRLDRAFVFSSSMAQYVMGPPARGVRRVADLVDVDSEKWRQYAERRRWPARAIFGREGRLLLEFERRVGEEFAAVIFVSRQEAELFRRLTPAGTGQVFAVANGVDETYFSPAAAYLNPFPTAVCPIVFVGAMDYWPNVDAARWFATEILPRVPANGPPVGFYVVGANPTPEVTRLARLPGVTVTGRVADVRPFLAHAAAVVAPMRIARGIQNKILEGMAMGRVVVTTSQGLEGIDAEPGRHVRVADDAATFAAAVGMAIAGNDNATFGPRARAQIVARHVWGESARRIEAIIEGDDHGR